MSAWRHRRVPMDAVLGATLVPLIGFEAYAIVNRLPGDTISERTRVYFQVKGKTGSYVFLAFLGSASAWFASHIVGNAGTKV